jgi:Flavin containing amine oxidoreductase
MFRVQALNRKRTHYSKIRGGNDLLPKAFAVRLSEKIQYGAPVVRIEQSPPMVKVVFVLGGTYHTLTGDYLICAILFSVQKNIEVAPAFSVEKQRRILSWSLEIRILTTGFVRLKRWPKGTTDLRAGCAFSRAPLKRQMPSRFASHGVYGSCTAPTTRRVLLCRRGLKKY